MTMVLKAVGNGRQGPRRGLRAFGYLCRPFPLAQFLDG